MVVEELLVLFFRAEVLWALRGHLRVVGRARIKGVASKAGKDKAMDGTIREDERTEMRC